MPGSLDPLALVGVRKEFSDGTRALDDVSFAVAPGELVSLVGPSGCGKTTALRLAAGLEQPTSGQVLRTPEAAASLGVVFQDATLLEWRTALSNVALVPELRGAPTGERNAMARAMLDAVGLGAATKKRPRELSGGMRMRVAMARALVSRPELALFDEPFGALDEITRLALQVLLQDLFDEAHFAALFVTHSVSEAVYLSDRVLVMERGRIFAEVMVPWERPRPPELRYAPEFAALAGETAALLAAASAAGEAQ